MDNHDQYKVDAIFLSRAPIFEWYVARCGSKISHQKDTRLKEIELHAQSIWTIVKLISQQVFKDFSKNVLSTDLHFDDE